MVEAGESRIQVTFSFIASSRPTWVTWDHLKFPAQINNISKIPPPKKTKNKVGKISTKVKTRVKYLTQYFVLYMFWKTNTVSGCLGTNTKYKEKTEERWDEGI